MASQSIEKSQRARRSSKRFQCKAENCGKVYSRAEHLSRHQLNHDPKEIYRCDVPKCCCSFVRLDLYNLHRTRHMREYLQDRDSAKSTSNDNGGSMVVMKDSTYNQDSRLNFTPSFNIDTDMETTVENQNSSILCSRQVQAQVEDPLSIRAVMGDASTLFDRPTQENSQTQTQPQNVQNLPPPHLNASFTSGLQFVDGDSYVRPTLAIPEDLIQFLFSENHYNGTPMDHCTQSNLLSYNNSESNASLIDEFVDNYLSQPQPDSATMPYQKTATSKDLSNEKSMELYNFMQSRLVGLGNGEASDLERGMPDADSSRYRQLMSREMMQNHIENYWRVFHPQLPICKNVSSPDQVSNILLISIIILGASCSTESFETIIMSGVSEFCQRLAWCLRWEIFRSMHLESDSLSIYQALLHLELYEKTYSSRNLHERAHIHHATTITMMRRGSFLAGKSPLDTPPQYEEYPNPDGESWWDRWIQRESTRRVAFAAFMIDSLHASMFGHSMTMVTHELRLTLPCDDSLWMAASGGEVQRIERTLRSNGVAPIPFLEGLRRTLNGQMIHTNGFGRSVLLCGVLSVSWHMSQRDIQLNSLEIASHRVERGTKWRRSISRAFDLWRESYMGTTQTGPEDPSRWSNWNSVLGSRSTLYYLAQLSLNIDIVECQIFAGADRVLGRVIGAHEVENVQHKIKNVWAPSLEARKATFYAIRFLCSVFREAAKDSRGFDRDSIISYATNTSMLPVHRWVLYSAALVVWSYTYAVDGPSHLKTSAGASIDDYVREMDSFLSRAENIKSAEDVAFYRLNSCSGMLHVLCFIFRMGTWDLLLEGADLLANCIQMIENVG